MSGLVYELEIETRSRVIRIVDPRMAKATEHFFHTNVKVKDGNGIWHSIGRSPFPTEAESIAKKINNAILNGEDVVFVDI